jgi:predicted dehydrogenase
MRYVVEFENAVADFDLSREPTLLLHDAAMSQRAIEMPAGNGYDHQAVAMVRAVLAGGDAPVALTDALTSLRMVEAERASASAREPVAVER